MAPANGYLKDAFASFSFFAVTLAILSRPREKWWCLGVQRMLALLVLSFCGLVDLLYTLNPEWHCREFTGRDIPSFIHILHIALAIAALIYIVMSPEGVPLRS
jgi:hypothetical protein